MQRKRGKTGVRLANADEKKFAKWCKNHSCIVCGLPAPSIVDHMYGSTFRHNKVLVGHWALLPLCESCDEIKTLGSLRRFEEITGRTQASYWLEMIEEYHKDVPWDVIMAIKDWGR